MSLSNITNICLSNERVHLCDGLIKEQPQNNTSFVLGSSQSHVSPPVRARSTVIFTHLFLRSGLSTTTVGVSDVDAPTVSLCY